MVEKKNKRKGRTATGAGIIELALRLKKKDPSLSFEDAKYQASEEIKSKEAFDKKRQGLQNKLIYGVGGKTKHSFLTELLGKGLGGAISNKIRVKGLEENMANQLIAHDAEKENEHNDDGGEDSKKSRIESPSDYKQILKKLTAIEASVKAIKAVKVADPAKKEKSDEIIKTPEHEDARAGLEALGYKKNEIDEMLKNAKGTTAQELIKDALKDKNKEKIPVEQVPMAIEAAKKEIEAEPIHTANMIPKTEPTAMPVTSPVVPVPVQKNTDEAQADTQKESMEKKTEEKHEEEVAEDKKQKADILKELDDIEKHVEGGGLIGLLSKFFAPMLALLPMISTALAAIAPILGGLVAIAAAAYAGYKIGKWLDDKFHISTKIGEALAPKYENKASAPRKELIASTNKKLEGTGYTSQGGGKFTDPSGNTIDIKDLPPNVKAKIGIADDVKPVVMPVPAASTITSVPAASTITSVPAVASTAAATMVASNAKAMASAKIDEASSENTKMKSDAPVPIIQNITNNRPAAQMPQGSSSGGSNIVRINVRNMEPSVGSYVSEIFNHPVLRLPM
jgi:hypothetical protein